MPARKKSASTKGKTAKKGKIVALIPSDLGLTKAQVRKLQAELQKGADAIVPTGAARKQVTVVTCNIEWFNGNDN